MKYLVEDFDDPADPVQDYAEAKQIVRKVLGSHPSVRQAATWPWKPHLFAKNIG